MGDSRSYDLWAQEIARGHWLGDRVFYQAPLYPYFLATLYWLFGHHLFMIRVVQIILGATSCLSSPWLDDAFFPGEPVRWQDCFWLSTLPPFISIA